jgi:hypothetical protein
MPTIDFGNEVIINHSGDGNHDIFLVKYNTDGTAIWAKSINAINVIGTAYNKSSTSIAVDLNGNIHLAGSFDSPSLNFGSRIVEDPWGRWRFPYPINIYNKGAKDLFVVKYNSNGTTQWAQAIGGESDDQAKDLVIDNEGNVYLAAYSESLYISIPNLNFDDPWSRAIVKDAYLIKLNSNGRITWANGIVTNQSADIFNIAIAVDMDQNVYMAGGFSESINFWNGIMLREEANSDSFLVKYNVDGMPQWANKITKGGGIATGGHRTFSIAVDSRGYTYITGYFYSIESGDFSLLFGNGITATLENDGRFIVADIFLVQYDENGQALWANGFSAREGLSSDVIVDQYDNVYLTGQAKLGIDSFRLDFGNDVIATRAYINPDNAEEDMFLVKFSQNLIAGLFTPDQYFDEGFNFSTINLCDIIPCETLNTLIFTASSENEKVATIFLEDTKLIIQERGIGSTIITIAAKDKKGEIIKTQFKVTISNKKQLRKASFSGYTEEITAYPNPVVNELQVAVNSEFIGEIVLQLFNAKGDMVLAFTTPKASNSNQYKLDMQNLPNGLFLLKIIQGEHYTAKKIIK